MKKLLNLSPKFQMCKITNYANLSKAMGDVRACRAIGRMINSTSLDFPIPQVIYSNWIVGDQGGR